MFSMVIQRHSNKHKVYSGVSNQGNRMTLIDHFILLILVSGEEGNDEYIRMI